MTLARNLAAILMLSGAFLPDIIAGTVRSATLGPDGQLITPATPSPDGGARTPSAPLLVDTDSDQLPDAVETIVNALGPVNAAIGHDLDAARARSLPGQLVPDYFLRAGGLYLGQMFTDHDWMEDAWEDLSDDRFVSRHRYDPWDDSDGDGWSNFAECRACVWGDKVRVVTSVISNIVSRSFKKGEESSANTFEEVMKRQGLWIRTDEHSIEADSVENLDRMVNKTITYWQTNEVTRLVYDYARGGGVPTPTIDLSVAYAGNVKSEYYVVCAWGRDASVLDLPDARWTVVAASNIAQVVFSDARNYTLGACEAPSARSKGKLREGLNTFVVYAADTVDAAWKPGKPFGVVKNVDVGWSTASVVVNVTDTSAQMARFDLVSAIGADFAGASAATDRGVFGKRGDYLPNVPEVFVGTNMPAKTATTRVRIVRNWINEVAHERYTKLVWDGDVDLTVHPTLTEADLLKDGMLGLDWGTLTNDYLASGARSISTLGSATYRVVIGDGPMGDFENFGNNLAVQFVNVFEMGVTQSMTVADGAMPEIIYGARPTFRWTHPNTVGKAYPAFQLKIWRTTDNVNAGALVYDSGALPAPARDENGVYSWTAPICAGMALPDGTVFETTNNYLWAVSMLDAKFTGFNANEKKHLFRLQPPPGSLAVCVKYMGPATVNTTGTNGLVRVAVYETPDFSGLPVCETHVRNTSSISSATEMRANALFDGIPNGTYYVRAFIDTDGDGVKSNWESWGYGCRLGQDPLSCYNPLGFDVKTGVTPTAVVYVEDADTNGNRIPDAIEYEPSTGSLSGHETPSRFRLWYPWMPSGASSVEPVNVFDAISLDDAPFLSLDWNLESDGAIDPWALAFSLAGRRHASSTRPEIDRFGPDGIGLSVYSPALLDRDTLMPTGRIESALSARLTLEHRGKTASDWSTETIGTWSLPANGIPPSTAEEINSAVRSAIEANRTNHMYRVRIDY